MFGKKRLIHPKRGQMVTMRHSGTIVRVVEKTSVNCFQTKPFRVRPVGISKNIKAWKVQPNSIVEMRADYVDQKDKVAA